MKKLLIAAALTLVTYASNAQTGIQLQRCLGDTYDSRLNAMAKTSDGGYIFVGQAHANTGDVNGIPLGGRPCGWIVKLNGLGDTVWTRAIAKVLATPQLEKVEEFHDVIQTSDGGYVALGSCQTYKQVGNFVESSMDFFIIKLSANGQEEWYRFYGGSERDVPNKIIQTPDGGFLCIGIASWADFDVTGFHPNANESKDGQPSDVWLVKLSSTGNLEWQKCYGGDKIEMGHEIMPTPDGNYIFVVSRGGLLNQENMHDIWVVKIDPSGNVIWEKTFGGSSREWFPCIEAAQGGGYVIACDAYSSNNIGTGNHGLGDVIIFKITEDGNLVWSRAYGGSSGERASYSPYSLAATADGGYVFVGTTDSKDGDLTGVGPANDENDPWVMKLDASGNILWQKTFGGSDRDDGVAVLPDHSSNAFIVLSNVQSHDGDVFRNKATSLLGENGWFVRLGPVNTITGMVFKDLNSNGVRDAGEPLVTNALVQSSKPGYQKSTYSQNGRFINEVDTGQYTTSVYYSPYYTSTPLNVLTPARTTYFKNDTINFALQPIPGIHDFSVFGFPMGPARPGFNVSYRAIIKNPGTENVNSGVLKFVKDSRLSYLSASSAVSSQVADTLRWNFSGLNVGDSFAVTINFRLAAPPLTSIGDTLKNMVISPLTGDQNPSDDTAFLRQVVTGSYDPNDKREINGGKIPSAFVAFGDYLQYMIRFQNTGTDTAFNVTVRDTLDAMLDWSTIQMVASSHQHKLSIESGNRLSWWFANINLVDSNRNEPLSHGYIVYRIKPKNTVRVNDVLHNTASIYFDYNLPIVTNDAITLVQDNFITLPATLLQFKGHLANNIINLSWRTAGQVDLDRFEVERSLDGINFIKIGSKIPSAGSSYDYADAVGGLGTEIIYYRLRMVDADGSYKLSGILVFRLSGKNRLEVFPVPVTSVLYLSYKTDVSAKITVEVLDLSGRVLLTKPENIQPGTNTISINEFAAMPSGTYLIRLSGGNKTLASTMISKAGN